MGGLGGGFVVCRVENALNSLVLWSFPVLFWLGLGDMKQKNIDILILAAISGGGGEAVLKAARLLFGLKAVQRSIKKSAGETKFVHRFVHLEETMESTAGMEKVAVTEGGFVHRFVHLDKADYQADGVMNYEPAIGGSLISQDTNITTTGTSSTATIEAARQAAELLNITELRAPQDWFQCHRWADRLAAEESGGKLAMGNRQWAIITPDLQEGLAQLKAYVHICRFRGQKPINTTRLLSDSGTLEKADWCSMAAKITQKPGSEYD